MKKIYLLIFLLILNAEKTFAANSWIFWGCLEATDIRNGNFEVENIACTIDNAINFFMWIAGTIAVIFIIIWAYQMVFSSLTWWDRAKWKKTVILAISWFVLAAFSWVIIKFIIDNFS